VGVDDKIFTTETAEIAEKIFFWQNHPAITGRINAEGWAAMKSYLPQTAESAEKTFFVRTTQRLQAGLMRRGGSR
jgi:hypothetical protein